MATPKVLLKRSSVVGRIPDSSDLQYGELAINFADGKLYYKDDSNNIRAFIDSARVEEIANAVEIVAQSQLDSGEVTALIDSAYVQARVPLSYLEGLIDSAYIQARQTDQDFAYSSLTGAPNILDSANVTNIIDSAYVQARQSSAGTDSATVSAIILADVDSAYVQARQLDSAANATEAINSTNLNNQAASYYTDYNNLSNKPTILDTVDVSNIITTDVDKAFVDALNVDADTLDNQDGSYYLNYNNFTNTPNVLDSDAIYRFTIDSARTITLVDSAYVRARVRTNQDLRTTDDVTFGKITADSAALNEIKFNTALYTDTNVPSSLPPFQEGNLFYFQGPDALTYSNSDINVKIGQDDIVRVYNNTDSDIAKGKAVYITGATNDFPTIALAKADNFNTVYETQGLTSHSIPNNTYGYVTVRGLFGGLNTAAFSVGDIVHVSPDSAGQLVNFNPTHPNYAFEVGVVLVSDSASGGNVGGCIQVNPRAEVFETQRTQGAARFDGNVTIAGNLNILGTETKTSVSSLEVGDQFIYVGGGDTVTGVTQEVGNGLNDVSFKGHYTGDNSVRYYVRISDDHASHDKIQWSFDSDFATLQGFDSANGPTEVTLDSATPTHSLRYGISVQFEDENNHDSGDVFSGFAAPVNVDFGFSGNYNDSANPYTHAGFFRDATDARFKFFNKYNPEPEGSIDTSDASFEYGDIQANHIYAALTGNVTGNVTGTVSDISNHTTTNLTEGTNLYYTKARADSDIAASIDDSGNTVNITINNTIVDKVDSAYVLDRVNEAPFLDSADAIQLIDSAYVQARQITYNTSDFTDSAYVTGLPVSTFTNDANYLDSTTAQNLIDSAYVQARQTAQDFAFSSLTGTPTTIAGYGITDAFDGAYSSLTGIPALIDSDLTTQLIDSAYVQSRILDSNDAITGLQSTQFNFNATQTEFTVTVASKDATHRYNGQGSGSGYKIDGTFSPTIVLVPGNTYRFDQSDGSNSSHPLLFYYEADRTTQYSTNVTTNGVAGQAGAYTEIEVTDATPMVLHYQCQNHGYMGNMVTTQTRNLTGFDTDDLSEGSTNQYYTTSRANSAIDARVDQTFVDNLAINYTSLTGAPTAVDSAEVIKLITANAIDSGVALSLLLDSIETIALIDSAYVQARQTGGEITIQDEGSALSTAATTLNFVGSAVVASGTGTTKTITISQAEGGTDSATVVTIIGDTVDSAYVQLRQTSSGSSATTGSYTQTFFRFQADSGQTVFTGTDLFNQTLDYVSGQIDVFLNGILLIDSADYTQTNSSTLTSTAALDSGDEISVIYRRGLAVTPNVTTYEYLATASQSTFSGTALNGKTLAYSAGAVHVFVNGILLKSSEDYTATSGTSVILTTSTDSGDDVAIAAYAAPAAKATSFTFTADSAQTTFNGVDNQGNTLSYEATNSLVFLNGIVLNDSSDFTAANGTSVVLTEAANLNDELKVVTFGSVTTTQSSNNWSEVTTSIKISPNEKRFVDVSSAAITLEIQDSGSNVSMGDELRIIDGYGNAATNNITLRSTKKIIGSDSDLIIDINRSGTNLVYYNESNGWVLIEN